MPPGSVGAIYGRINTKVRQCKLGQAANGVEQNSGIVCAGT